VSDELSVLLWESNQACFFIGQEAGMCHWLACLPPMATLWSDARAVRRVASRCLACKWTVPNLAWWSVPNFAWWSVPNLHACMSYLYVCMCGCTTDTCLLVLYMLMVHTCCLCALLVCVVNGKSEYCLGGCFVLLHLSCIYECVVAMHGEER
jgi:hypothetical protein